MLQSLQLRLKPEIAGDELRLKIAVSTALDIDVNRIKRIDTTKRSIDARQRQVMINLTLNVHLDQIHEDADIAKPELFRAIPENAPRAIVVGAGPAGLFAALRLIQLGIKPIVLERGKDVDSRRRDLASISCEGKVDEDSNYCFGEGGAGAYSDGKLYTRSKKRGNVDQVLNILHQHGAPKDILIDAHPHIGSDLLPKVIKAIRNTIVNCGGEVHFNTRVQELVLDAEGKRVTGVVTKEGTEYHGPVILATGHSARDVYRMLQSQGIAMEPKGLAIGVRLEHPQALIDQIFYHSPKGRGKWLPAAEYSLLTRVEDRAVYSFCMCPGGYIIPAASEPGQIVVNGMSPANRGTQWANSGMVVEILPEDLPGDSPLKMMDLQSRIETKFYNDGDGSQNVPAQRMEDFVEGRDSEDLPRSSYTAGVHPARIDHILPNNIVKRLQQGFREFGKKYRGFLTNEALVVGDETRTSSPVRISRNPATLTHIEISDLYPSGEGAGYAGGIVSAAIDGIRCAEALSQSIHK